VAGRDVTVLVELVAREVGERNAGARSATARLIDLLLIAAIRRWLETLKSDEEPSWLTALGDPVIGRALATLHERPGERWTLDLLAREAHVSRATLARRFTETVGDPPLAYLARWRMHLAAHRLKNSDDTIDTIAREVGYTSEFAFSRAFARHRGAPPGRYRRLSRAA
jgi:AraC-like DNA-binding protein